MILNLNGYKYFLDVDTAKVSKVSNGRWEVKAQDGQHDFSFIVVGGRNSGGASNEWFAAVTDPRNPEAEAQWFPVKTMIAAIKFGIGWNQ